MAGKLRPLRIVPWVVTGGAWVAAVICADLARRVGMAWDRLIDCAAISATVWALLAAYDTGALSRDNKRRLDAYGEGWALLHEDAEAERRRARLHLVDRERRVP